MEQIFPLLLLLLLGMVLQKLPSFPDNTDRILNLFALYISLPALIFIQIPKLSFSLSSLIPIGMPWVVCCFSATFVLLAGRLFSWSRETTGALLLVVPLGNTSFLGIPMVENFFGANAISYAVLYDQFGSFLALSSYGSLILSIYGSGGKSSLWSIFKKICLFPPFLALIAAVFFRSNDYPGWLADFFSIAGKSLIPIVMVAVGFQLRIILPKRDIFPFFTGLLIKMFIAPLLVFYLCKFSNLTGQAVNVSIFETAMPPMVTAGALASIGGLKPQLTAAMVGWGIFLSFLTLPILFQLL